MLRTAGDQGRGGGGGGENKGQGYESEMGQDKWEEECLREVGST